MYAIIIVADKMEKAVNRQTQKEEICCPCMKISSTRAAKKLIKYLHQKVLLSRNDITVLRGSDYNSSSKLLNDLDNAICSHINEDILIYYAGHGGYSSWAFNNYPDEYLCYDDLEDIFRKFTRKLILINDCCHALSINQFLKRALKRRYLLFGSSRKNKFGETFSTIIDFILWFWSFGRKAVPRVTSVGYAEDGGITDFCVDTDLVFSFCDFDDTTCLHDDYLKIKKFLPGEQPSLRRGSDLDFLGFPKLAGD